MRRPLNYFNAIRERAGLPGKSSVSFMDILKERRVEFALEGINWFDIKRLSYRDQSAAVAYINAMERETTYQRDNGPNAADENTIEGYIVMEATNPISINADQLYSCRSRRGRSSPIRY